MTTQENMLTTFLREKPTKIALSLRKINNKYASQIAKEVNCTYSHTVKVLSQMQEKNLIQFKKEGRLKTIITTEKGIKIIALLYELQKELQ